VALGALGVYEPFAAWSGGGATGPLLGFGNLIAKGTREAVREKGVLGVALGALGVYEPFARWAGGGATVPLLGFGNLIAKGTREAVGEKGVLGALSGGLTAASAGIGASLFFALLIAAVFKPKEK
jgi:stage V sporulation protein AE